MVAWDGRYQRAGGKKAPTGQRNIRATFSRKTADGLRLTACSSRLKAAILSHAVHFSEPRDSGI